LQAVLAELPAGMVAAAFVAPRQPARVVVVCTGMQARRAVFRRLSALDSAALDFRPSRNESVVVEGLPRATTAADVTHLLERVGKGAVRPLDVTVTDATADHADSACTAVVTCCRLSDDCDEVIAHLHGKRLGGAPRPLCVYPLELQHTKWAPSSEAL
jgi:hypothetical protein